MRQEYITLPHLQPIREMNSSIGSFERQLLVVASCCSFIRAQIPARLRAGCGNSVKYATVIPYSLKVRGGIMSGTLGIGLLFNATWTPIGYICFSPTLICLLRLRFCAEPVTTKHASPAIGGGTNVLNSLSKARVSSSTVVYHHHRTGQSCYSN